MKSAGKCILTINGGSSSIRFAVYETGETLRRRLNGMIDRIGLSDTNLSVNDPAGTPQAPLISFDAGRVKVPSSAPTRSS